MANGLMAHGRGVELPLGKPFLWFAVIILTLFFAKALLIPLALALTLAFLLAPAVGWLERMRIPRVASVAIVGAVTLVGVLGVGYVVSRQLINVAQTLPAYQANLHAKVAALHSPAEQSVEKALSAVEGIGSEFTTDSGPATPGVPTPSAKALPVRVVDPGESQIEADFEFLMRFLRPVGAIGIVGVFTIYMLVKREELRHRLLQLAGIGHINLMTQALQDAATRISEYLVMQFAVNACYGLLFGSGLFLIGVPNATLWGVIAGLLRIVPYVGTLTGLLLPLVVSISVSASWWPPVLVLGLFLVLEVAVTNIVEPWLYSSRTGISSLALLASAIFWALLWGWPGLVLSTPLTVCMVVLGRYIPQMSFLNTLLGSEAELSAEAHFYERLLAMDQEEARAIVHRYLTEKSLVELYDCVLIPTLSLAEQDRYKGLLDEVRSNFLLLCVRELVTELAEYRETKGVSDDSGIRSGAARRKERKELAVVCVSTSEFADDLTTLMLAQLMERAGHPTVMMSAGALSTEVLAGLAAEPATMIFISALPPFALSQAKATCQRIRRVLEHNRIAVGLWNSDEEAERVMERMRNGRPDVVIHTMAQALQQVVRWQQRASDMPSLR
ncbi:MAG: transport protein [Acidobacteriaceae bacterium]|nr:transport protein [Acidobacteriaceae bacterium]